MKQWLEVNEKAKQLITENNLIIATHESVAK